MLQKDGRVKVMAEILRGIRVIKFHVWEDYFVEKVGSEYDVAVHINFTFHQEQQNIHRSHYCVLVMTFYALV
jgi:hypothetical protein